jgi:hypothetical protein
MRDTDDGVEILSTQDLDPDSLQRVVEMRQVAFESWWAPEHPGWGIIDEAPPDGESSIAALSCHHSGERMSKWRSPADSSH